MALIEVECCNCGVVFGMTKYMNEERLRDHKTFHCPNGHPQSYTGKTEEQKLKERLFEEEQRRIS